MTKEQNVVIVSYATISAISAGVAFHSFSIFLFVGSLLAYVLKTVNSAIKDIPIMTHSHELTAVEKEVKHGQPQIQRRTRPTPR